MLCPPPPDLLLVCVILNLLLVVWPGQKQITVTSEKTKLLSDILPLKCYCHSLVAEKGQLPWDRNHSWNPAVVCQRQISIKLVWILSSSQGEMRICQILICRKPKLAKICLHLTFKWSPDFPLTQSQWSNIFSFLCLTFTRHLQLLLF